MELVVATNNANKLIEIKAAIPSSYKIISLADIGYSKEIPEDYETLEENARQKAATISDFLGSKFKGMVMADDTGLEVEALNGRPGVYSARYAGVGCSYQDNTNKLLHEMRNQSNRIARFRTVISLLGFGQDKFFEGIVSGVITASASGQKGFGYDPVFQPLGYKVTFAEMELSEKNKISHRGRAVKALTEFLNATQH